MCPTTFATASSVVLPVPTTTPPRQVWLPLVQYGRVELPADWYLTRAVFMQVHGRHSCER